MPPVIHPLFVHFPIALLSLYAVLEIVRLPWLRRAHYWFYVRAVLVITGTIGAFAAVQTGEWIEGMFDGTSAAAIVEMHATLGEATLWIFSVLAAAYAITWIARGNLPHRLPGGLRMGWTILARVARSILGPWTSITLALIGFLVLIATGALGAALVHGSDVDPVVNFIVKFLVPQYE